MKKNIKIFCQFLVISLLCSLTACEEDFYYLEYDYQPSLKANYLYTSTKSLTFGSGKSSQTFDVKSLSTNWNISGMTNWLSVTPSFGNSDATVSASVTENNSADNVRTSVLYLKSKESDYGKEFAITATQSQASPYINVSEKNVSFSAEGGTKSLTVESNTLFTFSSSMTWLTVTSSTVSAGKYNLTLKAEPNTTTSIRTATVMLSGRTTEKITVTQSAAGITTTQSTTLDVPQKGGTYSVQIKADADWTATNNGYSWIEVSPTSGKAGTSTVNLTIAPNNSTSVINGKVSFRIGTTTSLSIDIKQSGLYLTVSQSSLTFDADACNRNLEVKSNVTWRVLSKPIWITVSQEQFEGDKVLSVGAQAYNETTDRNGEIVLGVDGLNIQRKVNVIQKGRSFSNLVGTLQYDAKAGTQSFDVTTDGSWTATSSESWLTLSKSSGKGNATVNATVTENTGDDQRTATIAVSVGGSVKTIIVTQASHYLTISPTTMDEALPSTGGSYKFSVVSDDAWQATKKTSWLTLSQTSGMGNVDITMTAADNPSVNDRRDTVLITPAHGQGVRLIVIQSARYLRVKTLEINFFYRGGESEPIEIETDGTYQISKEGDWFSIKENGKSFTVTATENTTDNKRQGKVKITLTGLKAGESKTIEIPVIQRNKSLGPDRDDFPEDEDWSLVIGDTHAIISITRFGSDEDWNIDGGGSDFKVTVTGFDEDSDWNKLIR